MNMTRAEATNIHAMSPESRAGRDAAGADTVVSAPHAGIAIPARNTPPADRIPLPRDHADVMPRPPCDSIAVRRNATTSPYFCIRTGMRHARAGGRGVDHGGKGRKSFYFSNK